MGRLAEKLLSDGVCPTFRRSLSPLRFLIFVCVVALPSWQSCGQSMVREQSRRTALSDLSPADRTQESFTRGAYRFFDNDDVTRTALHMPMQEEGASRELISPSEGSAVWCAMISRSSTTLDTTGRRT